MQRLVIACLSVIFSCSITVAQDKGNYCEPSPDVKEELKKVSELSDQDMPNKQVRERQSAMLQELLKKYPDDFHVRKRFQNDRRYAFNSDQDALIREYRAQMEEKEGDPTSVYFYSRLLVGRKTKEAIRHLEKLTQQSPNSLGATSSWRKSTTTPISGTRPNRRRI